VVDSTDISKFAVGQYWEHDDGSETNAEGREIYSIDADTNTPSAYRGAEGTTAVQPHADNSFLLLEPRYRYNTVLQAINQCLDFDLFPHVYEIVEHQIVSNIPANGHTYNAPATACEKFLDVYQVVFANDPPRRAGITYTVYPQNVDTALWANGKAFEIYGGKQDGTEKFYVNCAHRVAIGTLLARQERIVQVCAARYLMEWTNPRRLQGPSNQGDRSIRPQDTLQAGAYFAEEFRRMLRNESKYLKGLTPRRKVFVRGTVTYGHSD
jgi:hypothetical protein